jgi:hypothetical protein
MRANAMLRRNGIAAPAALLLAAGLAFTLVAGSTSWAKDRIDHQGPPRQCAGYSTNNPAYKWCLEDAKRKQTIRGGY